MRQRRQIDSVYEKERGREIRTIRERRQIPRERDRERYRKCVLER